MAAVLLPPPASCAAPGPRCLRPGTGCVWHEPLPIRHQSGKRSVQGTKPDALVSSVEAPDMASPENPLGLCVLILPCSALAQGPLLLFLF